MTVKTPTSPEISAVRLAQLRELADGPQTYWGSPEAPRQKRLAALIDLGLVKRWGHPTKGAQYELTHRGELVLRAGQFVPETWYVEGSDAFGRKVVKTTAVTASEARRNATLALDTVRRAVRWDNA